MVGELAVASRGSWWLGLRPRRSWLFGVIMGAGIHKRLANLIFHSEPLLSPSHVSLENCLSRFGSFGVVVSARCSCVLGVDGELLFMPGSTRLCVSGLLVSVLALLLLRERPIELGCLQSVRSALFSICHPRGFWRVVLLLLPLHTCYSL